MNFKKCRVQDMVTRLLLFYKLLCISTGVRQIHGIT